MKEKIIAIAADHAGFELKEKIRDQVSDVRFQDLGTNSLESVDYPDFAAKVCREIIHGRAEFGILICGSGIGMSIAANRHPEIRAALCRDAETVKLSRQHNNANILVLPARQMDEKLALECVDVFLNTEFSGGRHEARVEKLGKI